MTDSDQTRIEALYQQALDLPAEERAAFVADRVPGELRERVQALLDSYDSAQGSHLSLPHDLPTGTPDRIGDYEIDRVVGEGGMGTVYLARQLEPIARQVAIKVAKGGASSQSVLERFRVEQESLARLDHPNIARIFDAGISDNGNPFFVMEFVAGSPICEYADGAMLSLRERINLFMDVCQAVQYAHQRGVIHRDLKPSNILVTNRDGKPLPKVIDFGIAKALGRPEGDLTLTGQLLGTPEYMSPEQAAGQPTDTRTDVYALGVVLYELLVGIVPFPRSELKEAAVDAIFRVIRENEPDRPSTRVQGLGDTATDSAHSRGLSVRTLVRNLRGDLDHIVMCALSKEQDRRYQSPTELATDLGRYLSGAPVSAQPPSLRYRSAKFVRRHRLGVAVAATAIAGLVAIAVVSRVQSLRIADERDRATQEAQVSREVADHFGDLFHQTAITERGPDEVSVRDLLGKSVGIVSTDTTLSPAAEIRLRRILGDAYSTLAETEDAVRVVNRAIELSDSLFGRNHIESAESRYLLIPLLTRIRKPAETLTLADDVLPVFTREFGADDDRTLRCRWYRAGAISNLHRREEALVAYRELVDDYVAKLGNDHARVAMIKHEYARELTVNERIPEAVAVANDMRRVIERRYGRGSFYSMVAVSGLVFVYRAAEEADSVRVLTDLYESIVSGRYPKEHRSWTRINMSRTWLAVVDQDFKAADEHLRACEAAIAGNPISSYRPTIARLRSRVDTGLGRYDSAWQHCEEGLALTDSIFGSNNSVTWDARLEFARVATAAGRFMQADSVLNHLLAEFESQPSPAAAVRGNLSLVAAQLAAARGEHEQSRRFAQSAIELLRDTYSPAAVCMREAASLAAHR